MLANGAYGLRMAEIAQRAGLCHTVYEERYDRVPQARHIEMLLREDPAITHVSVVHCETTSGILNDIQAVARIVKGAGKTLIVDAMSSFGGVEIPMEELGIDFLISSANKCIQGVPGFSFILARRTALEACAGKARSLSLDLYAQWKEMEADGKWRFTSPTHTVLAFAQALRELDAEGGVPARQRRYAQNNRLLIEGMRALGFQTYIDGWVQSPYYHDVSLPVRGVFLCGDVRVYQGAGICHLSRKVDGCGYVPHRQYRGDIPGGYSQAAGNLPGIHGQKGGAGMRGKIEAVIFDWAGTVVDYGSFAPVEAFRRAFAEAGVQPTTEEITQTYGPFQTAACAKNV